MGNPYVNENNEYIYPDDIQQPIQEDYEKDRYLAALEKQILQQDQQYKLLRQQFEQLQNEQFRMQETKPESRNPEPRKRPTRSYSNVPQQKEIDKQRQKELLEQKRQYEIYTAPHVFVDIDGSLSCEDGYMNDQVFDKRGCWVCEELCDENAKCSYSSPGLGKCKCKPGYTGNGVHCNPPVPEIVELKTNKRNNEIKINDIPGFEPEIVWCKFGKKIVKGEVIDNRTIHCWRPNSANSKAVAVSFNKHLWSEEESVGFLDGFEFNAKWLFLIGVIVFVALVLFVLMKGGKKNNPSPDEFLPLMSKNEHHASGLVKNMNEMQSL